MAPFEPQFTQLGWDGFYLRNRCHLRQSAVQSILVNFGMKNLPKPSETEYYYRSPAPTKVKPGPSVLTIQPHRPWLCPVIMVASLGLLAWIGMFFCQRSTLSLDESLRTLLNERTEELEASEQNHASLQAQNKELRDKITTLLKTTQKDQETYTKVLQTLSNLQEDRRDLIEELNFYKKLLVSSTTPTTSKVKVSRFTITYDGEHDNYFYKLVLTESAKEPQVTEGSIQIEILGKVNGKKNRLSMKQLTSDASSSLPYKVTYFQRLNGRLNIPKDFLPDQVMVRISPQGQTKTEDITFNWTDLQKQEQP